MDAAGIDMQVLSLTSPGVEQLDAAEAIALARDTNDFLADVVKQHPQRFAGLAVLPTRGAGQGGRRAGDAWCARHKFVGAVINGHNRGRYLDDKFFWPILECAETLNVPIYLHPTPPPQAGDRRLLWRLRADGDRDARRVGLGLAHRDRGPCHPHHSRRRVRPRSRNCSSSSATWARGCRSCCQRLDIMPPAVTKLKQPISAYLRENVHYTFSGFNFPAAFLDLLLELGGSSASCSRPTIPITRCRRRAPFWSKFPVSAADKERIAHGNAEKLFGL